MVHAKEITKLCFLKKNGEKMKKLKEIVKLNKKSKLLTLLLCFLATTSVVPAIAGDLMPKEIQGVYRKQMQALGNTGLAAPHNDNVQEVLACQNPVVINSTSVKDGFIQCYVQQVNQRSGVYEVTQMCTITGGANGFKQLYATYEKKDGVLYMGSGPKKVALHPC